MHPSNDNLLSEDEEMLRAAKAYLTRHPHYTIAPRRSEMENNASRILIKIISK